MLKTNIKKLIVTICCVGVCVFTLAGCSQFGFPTTAADAEKAATSAYFAEVNSVVNEFKTTIGDFSSDVKEKKVDSLKDKVDACDKLVNQFSKLDVPKIAKMFTSYTPTGSFKCNKLFLIMYKFILTL